MLVEFFVRDVAFKKSQYNSFSKLLRLNKRIDRLF